MLEYVRTEIFQQKRYYGITTLFRQKEKKKERGGLLQPLSPQSLDDVISPKHRLVLCGNLLKIALETELTLDDGKTGRSTRGQTHTEGFSLQTCANGEETVDVDVLAREHDGAAFVDFDCHFFFPPHIHLNLSVDWCK